MSDNYNEKIITFVDKMPAFPKSVQRVMELTSDFNSSTKELVQVIESDPVMTVKILKVINSPFYGFAHKVTSIQKAVVYIGLNTVKSLALSVAAIGVLNKKNKAGFDTQDFLLHSLTTASICRLLAERLGNSPADSNDFFVAGLLHDFGKIVFAEFDPENFKLALDKSILENRPLDEVEIEFMGGNHAQAGGLLAKKWDFNQSLINAIEQHHSKTNNDVLSDCVFIANQISKKLQLGFAGNPIVEEFSDPVFARFKLSLTDLMTDLGDLSAIKTEALSFIKS